MHKIDEWRDEFPLRYGTGGDWFKPQKLMETLQAVTAGDDVIFTTGVGQHQMWAMQYLLTERPRNFITSGGLGTMGYGIPAAIGAKAARPEATVVCVDGDGCFQMTAQELTTAVLDDLPIIVVLVNNGSLGMVTQWQDMFFDGRRSHVDLGGGVPDYVKLAEAYGGVGMLVENEEEFEPALREALSLNRTVVIDCRVDPAEQCFPMIPAGAAAIDMVEYEDPVGGDAVKHTISRPRRGQARRAGPDRDDVRAARLQHRLARGRADRARRRLVHHPPRRRRAPLPGADREADPQARQRAPRHRARSPTRPSSGSCSCSR